jgi:hypothetical protein
MNRARAAFPRVEERKTKNVRSCRYTDECIEATAAIDAINVAHDPTVYQAAYDAMCSIPNYRCCGVYETEAEARASVHSEEREIAYLFTTGCGAAGGRFALYAGRRLVRDCRRSAQVGLRTESSWAMTITARRLQYLARISGGVFFRFDPRTQERQFSEMWKAVSVYSAGRRGGRQDDGRASGDPAALNDTIPF